MKVHLKRQTRSLRLKNRRLLILAVNQALTAIGLNGSEYAATSLSVVFLGPVGMRRINRRFLNHDYATDVISFNLQLDGEAGADACLGEILVCPRVAENNAREYRTTPAYELMLYIVHGLLHISGLDDQTESQRKQMRRAESKVMNGLAETFEFSDFFEFL